MRRFFLPAMIAAVVATNGYFVSDASAAAFADDPLMSYVDTVPLNGQPVSDLSPDDMYKVTVSCSHDGKMALPVKSGAKIYDIFRKSEGAASHFIVVTPSQPVGILDPSKITNSTAVVFVFAADSKTHSAIDARDATCGKTFLLVHPSPTLLIGNLTRSETYTASQLGSITSALVGFFGTAGLVSMGDVAAVSNAATQAGALASALKSNQLNVSQHQLPLRVGRTQIATDYSVTTVDVAKLSSVIGPEQNKERDKWVVADFKTRIPVLEIAKTTADVTATPSPGVNGNGARSGGTTQTLDGQCAKLSDKLYRDGFQTSEDQTFALMYAATGVVADKDELIRCLGKDRAIIAAQNHFWSSLPKHLIYDDKYAAALPPK